MAPLRTLRENMTCRRGTPKFKEADDDVFSRQSD